MNQDLKSVKQGKLSKNTRPTLAKMGGPVIWALDSATLNQDYVKKVQSFLESINYDNSEIIPTTVCSPFDLGWMGPADKNLKKKVFDRFKKETEIKWSKFSVSYPKSGFLISESSSKRDRVLSLIQYSLKKKAKIIVVGSGAKSRSALTGLGSFSETLISLSPIPVLVLGEGVKTISPVSKILFPTDFSDASKKAFHKVVQFAKTYKAEVILYHFLNLEMGPMAYGIPWGYEVKWLDEYWKVQTDLKEEEGKKWRDWAIKQGIKCQFICDRKIGNLSERVLETAQSNQADMLAMAVKRGPWSQVILGRNVRELFAHTTCPVLAIHANLKKEKLHS